MIVVVVAALQRLRQGQRPNLTTTNLYIHNIIQLLNYGSVREKLSKNKRGSFSLSPPQSTCCCCLLGSFTRTEAEFSLKRTRSSKQSSGWWAGGWPFHKIEEAGTMLGRSAATAARVAARSQPKGQKRTFIDYLTNYPDRVQEIKKIQNKGGTCLGEANPTWLKQPGDMGVALVGAGLTAFGTINCIVGHYRLATGKGKLE